MLGRWNLDGPQTQGKYECFCRNLSESVERCLSCYGAQADGLASAVAAGRGNLHRQEYAFRLGDVASGLHLGMPTYSVHTMSAVQWISAKGGMLLFLLSSPFPIQIRPISTHRHSHKRHTKKRLVGLGFNLIPHRPERFGFSIHRNMV